MFGYLREIRSACQFLQEFTGNARKRAAAMEAAARAAYLLKELSAEALARVDARVTPQLQSIQGVFQTDAAEFEWCSDNVTSIVLRWARVKDLWPAAGMTADEMEQRLKQAEGEVDQIIYLCESLTLSPRVNDVLANLRVGQPLDVEFEFGPEFPKDEALRKRLILELAQESVALESGIVDVDNGVICKVAPSRGAQKWSFYRILIAALFGFAIPVLLVQGDGRVENWALKQADLQRLLVSYLFILLGSGAHLAVDALKNMKAASRPSFEALYDWVLWVHIRESQFMKGIFSVWAGYLLLVFLAPALDWTAAFFAGYSIDSVTDVFLKRFEAVAAVKTKALTEPGK